MMIPLSWIPYAWVCQFVTLCLKDMDPGQAYLDKSSKSVIELSPTYFMGFDVHCFIVNVFKIYMMSVFLTLYNLVYNLKILTYFIYCYINILINRHTFFI